MASTTLPSACTAVAFAPSTFINHARSVLSLSPRLSTRSIRCSRSFVSTSTSSFLGRSVSITSLPCIAKTSSRTFQQTMVLSSAKSVPGVLDTDDLGGVLMYPREGKLKVKCGSSVEECTSALLVIAVWAPEDDEADFELPLSLLAFEKSIGNGVLSEIISDAEFKAKSGQSTDVVRILGSGPKRVALYGLGKISKGSSSLSGAAKFVMKKGKDIKSCTSVGLYIEDASVNDVRYAAEGGVTGSFIDERYKEKKDTDKVPTEMILFGITPSPEYDTAIQQGHALAMGVITCKEVINAPANTLTPETLALASEVVAKECNLDIKVMGRDECQALGMGCYLGVGRGSTDEPKFIHMTYKPEGEIKKKICLVGKAVTFDTGGTNLKVGGMIELMKFDMGGSAAVLGTAKVIGELKPKGVEVHFLMPAVENMIGDRAIHPGDVLKASNGKTVEVINTDAEGRLCLADALVYGENLGNVDYIVDIATLTGANMIALGKNVGGMWTPSDDLADALMECSKSGGESFWRMPLVEEYADQMKSKIADLRNIGTVRWGGAIVASLFLKEFVTTKNWAHLDIAGPVWNDKEGGATGFGVKTLTKFVESHAE